MKEYKSKLINALVSEAQGSRIVGLKQTARSVGVERLSSFESREVLFAAAKQLPDYKIVQIVTEKQKKYPATASIWETGALVEKTVEFD